LDSIKLFAPTTFSSVAIQSQSPFVWTLDSVKTLYSILADGGKITLHLTKATDELTSFLKAAGFTQIESNETDVRAVRAQWQAAGALLKRKKPEIAP
jgi:hypothetical protein